MRYAILLALALTGCGPVAFKSVAATGQIGAGISTHIDAVRSANRHCEVMVANGDIKPETCEKLTAATPDAVHAMAVLAGYGSSLASIAKASDPALFDSLSVVLGGGRDLGLIALREGDVGRIAGATQALANLITHEYRRKKVKDVVKDANDNVVEVTKGLEAYLKTQGELLKNNVRDAAALNLTRSMGRCDEKDVMKAKMCLQDNLADRVVLHGFIADIDAAIEGLAGAQRSLAAFRSAHERLRKDVGKLDDADEDIYHDIVCRTSELYFGFGGQKPTGCE